MGISIRTLDPTAPGKRVAAIEGTSGSGAVFFYREEVYTIMVPRQLQVDRS